MKKWIGLVVSMLVGLISIQAHAESDPWWGPDKAKHFGVSAFLAGGGYAVGVGVFEKRSSALALGGGVALAAGIGKEVYDATGHGQASERDLVWDVVGTVTGLALAFGVDWLIRGSLHEEKSDHSSSQPLFVSPGSMMIRF